MKCFSKTDIGLVRSENQDRVWTGSLDEDAVAIILCDGMGGENAGSVASQMTIDFMSDRIRKGFRSNINRNYIRKFQQFTNGRIPAVPSHRRRTFVPEPDFYAVTCRRRLLGVPVG